MKKLTPVFVVERIEPCLEFWVDRLGFAKVVEVPEGDALGFVILVEGAVEIMYQSFESVRKDIPELAVSPSGTPSANGTYIEVENVDETLVKLGNWPLVVPKRITFYGATEFGVREPGGNLIIFAQQAAADGAPAAA
jgi:catechol 2,3-dioxygenase-like lactoylglutathione lyase family enzyme